MKNSKLKNLFTILFLGALWGALEATLGALLHTFPKSLFTSTNVVLLPIAYLLMARAYKKTGSAMSALFMGVVAAAIKAVCFFYVPAVQYVINPMVAIVLESLVTAAAFAVVKPEKVLSIKTLFAFVIASLVIKTAYVGYSIATANAFGSAYIKEGSLVWSEIVKYTLTYNAISLGYLCVLMGVCAILNREKTREFAGKIEKFVYSPVAAALMVGVAITVTVLL